jgi:nitric oxide dioxygenase
MISAASRPYIDASVPVLREHGLAITTRFYANMFEAHPELRNLFNMGNQASGVQQQSLASAVFAYAAHIERIVHKHVSVGIGPSHYPIVGRHLLGAIREVLGDAATPELMAAWDEAYWLLAGDLIAAEARLYQRLDTWPGELRALRVNRVEAESEDTVSVYLESAKGGSPGPFLPGQYVSVAMDWTPPDETAVRRQLRQYSLSDAPDQSWWRITVKRERGHEGQGAPAGHVSNWLHDHVRAGDVLQVGPACGDFAPALDGKGPMVLMSAGVGITPMVSVLKALAAVNPTRPVVFAHAARSMRHQSFRRELAQAARALPKLRIALFHEQTGHGDDADMEGLPTAYRGMMRVSPVLEGLDLAASTFYLCGPLPFMREQWAALLGKGMPMSRLHREVFGPEMLDHLLA